MNRCPVELDDLLLLAMDPANEDHEKELPRLKDEVHGSPVLLEKNQQHRVSQMACQWAQIDFFATPEDHAQQKAKSCHSFHFLSSYFH